MDTTEVRLYNNAIIHYITNRLPHYEKKERLPLLDNVRLKVIDAAEDYASFKKLTEAVKKILSEIGNEYKIKFKDRVLTK